jgi:uncharacterized membrane protein
MNLLSWLPHALRNLSVRLMLLLVLGFITTAAAALKSRTICGQIVALASYIGICPSWIDGVAALAPLATA